MENKKQKNPNFEAKKLIEPMIFEKEDGTPLINPLVVYDRPLNFDYPLPDVAPLGIEYYINWKKIERENNAPIFPIDYLRKFSEPHSHQLDDQLSDVSNTKHSEIIGFTKINTNNEKTLSSDFSPTPYELMNQLLKNEKIIIVNEKFFVYSGKSYEPKKHIDIARLITKNCRKAIYGKSRSFIDGVVNYLLIEPNVVVQQSEIPKKYISFQNGVLDISSQKFYQHSSDFLTLYEICATYYNNPNSIATPIFDNYIYTVTGGDAVLAERILQMLGYLLTPDKNGKCFFLLQGVSNSGKSVLVNLVQKLFSSEAVIQLEAQLFGDKFTASELIGKALCSFPDIPAAPLSDATVSRIKLYTGNDPITASVKFKANEKFICNCKFIFATNHAFLTQNEDQAFKNRIVTIPFKYSIPKEKETYELENLMFNERDGIVNKAIAAYYRLVSNKYVFAGDFKANEVISEIHSDSVDYRIHLYEYIKIYFEKDENSIVFTDDAYRIFSEKVQGVSMNDFSQYFQRYTCEIYDAHKGRKRRKGAVNALSCVTGIRFKSEVENDIS